MHLLSNSSGERFSWVVPAPLSLTGLLRSCHLEAPLAGLLLRLTAASVFADCWPGASIPCLVGLSMDCEWGGKTSSTCLFSVWESGLNWGKKSENKIYSFACGSAQKKGFTKWLKLVKFFYGKNRWVSLGKPVFMIATGDKKANDNLRYASVIGLFHLPHDCKTPPERGFKITSLSVSFLKLSMPQRGSLWWPHFQKFLLLWEGFFQHLLNLKCLQFKVIFILTLEFCASLNSCLNILNTWQPASPQSSDPRNSKIFKIEVAIFL